MDSDIIRPFLFSFSDCRLVLFICGSFFGSFINCMAQRIVLEEDWIISKSRCDCCGHSLGILDLIPVFSYVLNRGRCRYCHEKISVRYPLTEIFTGFLFLIFYVHHPHFDSILFRDLILVCILFGLSLVDLETYRIPDGLQDRSAGSYLHSLRLIRRHISSKDCTEG